MRIIPAIDIIEGKCVRLEQGDYASKKIYSEDPLEVAKSFEDAGIKYLHMVDLDGAKSNSVVNYKTLERIVCSTQLRVDFGGGLKSMEDIEEVFNMGATQITLGSVAVKKPELFLQTLKEYGPDKIILGADCMNRFIATNGWLKNSKIEVIKFIQNYADEGVRKVICTDIAKDGMLEGISTELYQEIIKETGVDVIASGGVSSIEDVYLAKEIGCEGVIIGKAIYEGKIALNQIKALC